MKQLKLKDRTVYYCQARHLKVSGCKWLQIILEHKTKEKIMKKKFKGFSYAPKDNSYAINLTNGKNSYLAGTWDTLGQKVTIIKEPFNMLIQRGMGLSSVAKTSMVLVRCEKGDIHSVMFDERWVNAEIKPLSEKMNRW